jgi:hypothetical protein
MALAVSDLPFLALLRRVEKQVPTFSPENVAVIGQA